MTAPLDLIWDGTSLRESYGLRVADFECPPPSPKLSIVSIPGGEDIDLTDALTGNAAFENRTIRIDFLYDGRPDGARDWQEVASEVTSLISGRKADFALSWDPGYTYNGRATVTDVKFVPRVSCQISVEITASPWKLREVHTVTVDAVGGARLSCASGRRPVHPAIVCSYPVTVNWRGTEFVVPAGDAYRLADVVFEQGKNELWLSIHSYQTATWADVSGRKWSDLAGTPWSRVVVQGGEVGPDFPGNGLVTLQWEESYL